MNAFIFDSSSVISMASNCLLATLKLLHENFNVNFYFGKRVVEETVNQALSSKRYKLEGFRILEMIKNGVFIIAPITELNLRIDEFLRLSNKIFFARGTFIKIIHKGEAESVILAKEFNCPLVIDEKTTRQLIENPYNLRDLLQKRLHTQVNINQNNLNKCKDIYNGIRIVRSTEIAAFAFEKGYFKSFESKNKLAIHNSRKMVLEALLWGLKLNGCSISENEIDDYIEFLTS